MLSSRDTYTLDHTYSIYISGLSWSQNSNVIEAKIHFDLIM